MFDANEENGAGGLFQDLGSDATEDPAANTGTAVCGLDDKVKVALSGEVDDGFSDGRASGDRNAGRDTLFLELVAETAEIVVGLSFGALKESFVVNGEDAEFGDGHKRGWLEDPKQGEAA